MCRYYRTTGKNILGYYHNFFVCYFTFRLPNRKIYDILGDMKRPSPRERKRLQASFLEKLGPNGRALKLLMDTLPDACFNMKDLKGRLMVLNRRNCEICHLASELDAVGHRSDEIFPSGFAKDYYDREARVIQSGCPVLNDVAARATDLSADLMISNVVPLYDTRGKLVGTANLYRLAAGAQTMPGWHGNMKTVTAYVNTHYAENIKVSALAHMTSFAEVKFIRLFKSVIGVTPGQYILRTRLNAARREIENTAKPLDAIAAECGFFDQSHFSRHFKRSFGITPSAYRRRHRQLERPTTFET